MQKSRVACIVVIPVGPNTPAAFLNDTVTSVFTFCQPGTSLVLIDNTVDGLREVDVPRGGAVEVLRCRNQPGARPLYGGLHYNLSKAFRFAADRYDFDTLLRLDDDALLIGPGADQAAIRFFRDNPDVGCLGSYRVTCTGSARDFTPARNRLRRELSPAGAVRHPRRWRMLRRLHALARENGYEDGEHCLGAAAFYSKACIERFAALGFLERQELRASNLGEDHLFGMMVAATGLRMADFATDGGPLGLAWQGLPASPAELLRMGKTVVHSVKFFGDMDQAAVRAEFRRLLSASGQPAIRAER